MRPVRTGPSWPVLAAVLLLTPPAAAQQPRLPGSLMETNPFAWDLGLWTEPDREVLARIPRHVAEALIRRGLPDAKGMAGRNRSRWFHVSEQRRAMVSLALAAARGDSDAAERAWTAIGPAFARQTAGGNFEIGALDGWRPGRADDLSGVACWLGDLCRALLVLQDSGLEPDFRARIAALRPGIQRAATWLWEGREELRRQDAGAAHRLLFDARAFELAGRLLGDSRLWSEGAAFLQAAASLLGARGGTEQGVGSNPGYGAASTVSLQGILGQTRALRRSPYLTSYDSTVRRLIPSVLPDGRIERGGSRRTHIDRDRLLGYEEGIAYEDVVFALAYFGAHARHSEAIGASWRALHYALNRRERQRGL